MAPAAAFVVSSRIKRISLLAIALTSLLGFLWLSMTNILGIQEEIRRVWSVDSARVSQHSRMKASAWERRGEGDIHRWGLPVNGTDHIIFFNAIPKTGCRSVARAAAMLSAHQTSDARLQISVLPDTVLNDDDQIRSLIATYNRPHIVGGHAVFVPFPSTSPVRYVNIMREPLERLVSHYYFNRYGDSAQPGGLLAGDDSSMMTLDECLKNKECRTQHYKTLVPTTISQLCGVGEICQSYTREAMLQAIRNLDHYTMVGLTEEMDTTVLLLEKMFPDIMRGLHAYFTKSQNDSMKKFKTSQKTYPSPETVAIIKEDLSWEYELYDEVKKRFIDLKTRVGVSMDRTINRIMLN